MRKLTIFLVVFLVATTAASAIAAPDAFHDAVSADGPVLHYRLNEATGPALNYGSLGSEYDATYFGSPGRAAVTSAGDTGVSFTGALDYLESATVAPMALAGNPSFSAEALVFLPSVGGGAVDYAPFLHWGDATGDGTMKSVYFGFHANDATHFFGGFHRGGLRTDDAFPLAEWYHIVWVRTGGGTANVGSILYVNGQVVSASDCSDSEQFGQARPLI